MNYKPIKSETLLYRRRFGRVVILVLTIYWDGEIRLTS